MLRCSEQIKEHPIFAAINLIVTISQLESSEWIGYNNTERVRMTLNQKRDISCMGYDAVNDI